MEEIAEGIINTKPQSVFTSEVREWGDGRDGTDLLILFETSKQTEDNMDKQELRVSAWVSSVSQLCLTLCSPKDCSPPGSSAHGILQARILGWVAISSSVDLPNPGIKPVPLTSRGLAGGFLTTRTTWDEPSS